MRINVLSVFLAVKHASAAMSKVGGGGKEESGGSILMTASSEYAKTLKFDRIKSLCVSL